MIQVKKARSTRSLRNIPLLDKPKESATIEPHVRPAAPDVLAVPREKSIPLKKRGRQ
jgi:hypothetical protein